MENKEEAICFLNRYFLSTNEAIELLDISKANFYSLIARGKITKIKKGTLVLYYREEIEERKRTAYYLRGKYRPFDYK